MFLWLAIGLMTVLALALLLVPLLRRPRAAAVRADYDLAVYRDQLKELESDLARGVIGDSEADAARTEIERRMLAAARVRDAEGAPKTVRDRAAWRRSGAALLGIGVPAAAVAIYVALGAPSLPSQPFAGVPATPAASMAGRSVEESIQNLARRLEAEPENLDGWLLLGRSYISLERYDEAADALRRAAVISNGNPDIVAAHAEAMVLAADGVVIPAARRAFEVVLEAQPEDPAAHFYIGLADAQAGHLDRAYERWLALAAETSREAPWRADLEAQIRRAAAELEIELATIPAAQAATPRAVSTGAAPTGPSAEDMAAASEMAPDARTEMIRGMVERLAARLEQEPDDRDGWQRLARAYTVLGETEKAAEAARRAEALGQRQPRPAPRGPTSEDMAAASEMAPDERAEMIRGMVEGLATRLESNPDDLAGWRRLARSYRVLGEDAKADEAERRVAALEQAGAGAPSARAATQTAQKGPSADDVAEAEPMSAEDRAAMIRGMVDNLAERLESEPDDLDGWLQLARSYSVLGEHGEALDAYQRAVDLAPDNVQILRDFARAVIAATPDPEGLPLPAIAIYERILTLDADHPEALWFVGFAEVARGNTDAARALWERLLAQLPPGTPDRKAVQEAINAL